MARRLPFWYFIDWDKGFVDILRHEFFDIFFGFGQRQIFKEIAQISVWLESIQFGCFYERIKQGSGFGSTGTSMEEPVLTVMRNYT